MNARRSVIHATCKYGAKKFSNAIAIQPRLMLTTLVLLTVAFSQRHLDAGLVTFNVNHSGSDIVNGNTLRLYGTISVDPNLPIQAATISSNLWLQLNADAPVAFSSTPNDGDAAPTSLAWSLINGNLHIVRTGSSPQYFGWKVENNPIFYYATLGAGDNAHGIAYANISTLNFNNVFFKNPSGPDGPNGFLFATAVPEPSSFVLCSMVGSLWMIVDSRRRKRRQLAI